MQKYNIALTPVSESGSVIKCAQNFSAIADQYLLGEKSLPHVTLYQFLADENDIDNIWKKVCQSLEQHTIDLKFEKFSCITSDNNIFWASLLPDHCDILMKMHSLVSSTLNKPIKDHYDPHMTLINNKNKAYENLVNEFLKSYTPIQDTFILSLGKSDDIGQLIEIVYLFQEDKKLNFRGNGNNTSFWDLSFSFIMDLHRIRKRATKRGDLIALQNLKQHYPELFSDDFDKFIKNLSDTSNYLDAKYNQKFHLILKTSLDGENDICF